MLFRLGALALVAPLASAQATSATQLTNYLTATVGLMKTLSRACGHPRLADFRSDDLSTWSPETARLTGVGYAGVGEA